ncbi:MAG TPA: DUF1153 domain-containing protein [Candidatus Paceibacterota bacterium]|nr:DUF1153 domain-containing protein [Candidatus Paceibacterota bacterium]
MEVDISRVTRGLPQEARGKMVRHPITGEIMTLKHLPPPDTTRWVIGKKAIVIAAVEGKLLTEEEARERYLLSKEELDSWRALLQKEGLKGLRVTHLRKYVAKPEPREAVKYPRREAVA